MGGQRGLLPGPRNNSVKHFLGNWYSAKPAGVKQACPNKVMAHMWFMHDAHLGRAFSFLDTLAEYTLLSMTIMVTPCLWYVLGMQYGDVLCQVSRCPFCARPWRMPR